ncbi:MAG: dienelactone hydrolase family protein [Acholeplasmatales bacterium]|jgi:acetyl esterase/lipase|nr:dienelactone hydrolase family protein [Acholeplasmatales bacterium]
MFNAHKYHSVIYYYRETIDTYPHLMQEALNFLQEIKNHPLVLRVHLIGFSAGAHLALSLAIASSSLASLVLFYPVVSTDPQIAHLGSINNISQGLPETINISLEKQIHENMPRTFLVTSSDDASVDLENSLRLISAYHAKKNKIEAHIYEHGRHGFSIITKETTFDGQSYAKYQKEHHNIKTFARSLFNFLKTV